MKVCLLTEEEHAALGARLSGMEVRMVEDREDLPAQWKDAVSDPSIGVLVISDSIYDAMADRIHAHREAGGTPLIVRLPQYGQTMAQMRQETHGKTGEETW